MKTSVSLSAFSMPKTAPVLFADACEENYAMLRDLGYDGVDLFVDDPFSDRTKDAVRLLNKYDLGVGVVMPAALAGQGLYLGDEDPSIRKTCIEKIGEICNLTADLGGMVSLGLVRGSMKGDETIEHFNKKFVDSCEKMLDISKVDLLIEPINRYEINTINSVREGIDFIKEVKLPLYLMIDIFHMNIEDLDIVELLKEANSLGLDKHIHFLDSNRLAPSMGHLDMELYYNTLKDLDYKGYLCLEALAKPTPYECAKAGSEFFKRMKNK